jgi:GAF domain-containing protein
MNAQDAGTSGDRAAEQRRRLRRLTSSLRAHGGLAELGAACRRDLPGVDGVVLTGLAAYAGWIILSDSGPAGDQLEDLHATLGEGPGIDAVVTAEPVTAADLDHPRARLRWPRFAAQAPTRDIRAVFSCPVMLSAEPVGVLSLYRAGPGPLSVDDHEQVGRYARAVTVLLLDNRHADSAGRVSIALPVRAGEVQQAVGVLMEYAGIDAVTALHRLRAYARRSARPMREVVGEVRTCRLPFDPAAPA